MSEVSEVPAYIRFVVSFPRYDRLKLEFVFEQINQEQIYKGLNSNGGCAGGGGGGGGNAVMSWPTQVDASTKQQTRSVNKASPSDRNTKYKENTRKVDKGWEKLLQGLTCLERLNVLENQRQVEKSQ